jgi:hypothetical protein
MWQFGSTKYVKSKKSQKLHGTQYTPQLETLFTNIAEHLTTYFTEYLHKIVTLARFGIGSLMMVQME